MGQRIMVGHEVGSTQEVAVLFDSVTGWAYGPVVDERDGLSGEDRMGRWLAWLTEQVGDSDLRGRADTEVEHLWGAWLATQPA